MHTTFVSFQTLIHLSFARRVIFNSNTDLRLHDDKGELKNDQSKRSLFNEQPFSMKRFGRSSYV